MRSEFLLDPDLTFLNHGSYGACPREVFQTYQNWQLEMERNPVAFLARRSAALLRDARSALAAYLGASADDLVLISNATTGVNIVAQSFDLQAGDEVLTTDLEYGACIATWERVCKERGATLRRVTVPLPLDAAGLPPDGHFKFPHLWPVKLLQAGRGNYQSFDVSRAMRALASLSR